MIYDFIHSEKWLQVALFIYSVIRNGIIYSQSLNADKIILSSAKGFSDLLFQAWVFFEGEFVCFLYILHISKVHLFMTLLGWKRAPANKKMPLYSSVPPPTFWVPWTGSVDRGFSMDRRGRGFTYCLYPVAVCEHVYV